MEKSRKFAQLAINNQNLSKTQDKKRRRKKYPNVFFKKEITQLFKAIENVRTMVATFLTFFCALRISEACKLQWTDVDLQDCRLKVVDGKNHKDGFIPISPLAIPILKKWRAMNPNEQYVLPTDKFKTGYYQPTSLLKDYKKALTKAGLEIPTEKNAAGLQQHQYKFHTLRHSRCTHLLNNGVPVQKVQKFMRHDDLETTMTYTWILDGEMNKMVQDADIDNYEEPTPALSNKATPISRLNPLEIAQKRLVTGEISVREYKKLTRALSQVST
ncbi:site-specific integrase [Candidatus Woesearchaeota archaeon]|nr:site-specific integrase [Candidatus Woesearchaeota archaeon]